ncbi:hypothetical protein J6590_073426 [Homalodisca vitripennis]|nr:hypothetical protein J6590_073426 [Homalodisca vitripennis]
MGVEQAARHGVDEEVGCAEPGDFICLIVTACAPVCLSLTIVGRVTFASVFIDALQFLLIRPRHSIHPDFEEKLEPRNLGSDKTTRRLSTRRASCLMSTVHHTTMLYRVDQLVKRWQTPIETYIMRWQRSLLISVPDKTTRRLNQLVKRWQTPPRVCACARRIETYIMRWQRSALISVPDKTTRRLSHSERYILHRQHSCLLSTVHHTTMLYRVDHLVKRWQTPPRVCACARRIETYIMRWQRSALISVPDKTTRRLSHSERYILQSPSQLRFSAIVMSCGLCSEELEQRMIRISS